PRPYPEDGTGTERRYTHAVSLSWLPEGVRTRIEACVEAIQRGAGEKLVSVLLVGAAAHPPRYRGEGTPQLLIVLRDAPVPVLTNLGHQVGGATCVGLRLQVLTERELLRGADVFSLELAEYRDRHVLLYGARPLLDDIHFTDAELRLAIERALRTLTREVRDALVMRAADLDGLMLSAVDRLVVIAQHLIRILGADDRGPEEEVVLVQLGEHVSVSVDGLLDVLKRCRSGEGAAGAVGLAVELLQLAEAATRAADSFGSAE
ncbi:MAG: hypothetical protein AAGA56_29345, partial [Myxococcota bacterium]